MSITFVYDAIHANVPELPSGVLAALYTTGTPDIKATNQDFINHPGALHICQDFGSDPTADLIDGEFGAATPRDVANWLPSARNAFVNAVRPGQRWPGLYASMNALPNYANAFVAAKLTNVPLWIADWGLPQSTAITDILNATQPYPIVGMQLANLGINDFSVFSSAYIERVSVMQPQVPTPIPPIPHLQTGWKYCRKCQGLFYSPLEAESHCSAGGNHDGSDSYDYYMIGVNA